MDSRGWKKFKVSPYFMSPLAGESGVWYAITCFEAPHLVFPRLMHDYQQSRKEGLWFLIVYQIERLFIMA